jgi:NMD protein affecting ribosome stability and mRNA decay
MTTRAPQRQMRARSPRPPEPRAKTGKGLIRSLVRTGTRDRKTRPAEKRSGRLPEPRFCERCGAIFLRRTWRQARKVDSALLARASWMVCPACEQTGREEYLGRVLIRGARAAGNEAAIRRRIRNVAARAEFTQPERRLVSVERQGPVLEVLTTSQKLAHRIVHELKKVFGGRASYRWSDDRSLLATWEPGDAWRAGVR